MPFTPEDGTGLPTANSYVSAADADTYFVDRASDDWAAASAEDRQAALMAATAYLDASFIWRGYLKSESQALGWPRNSARDEEGRLLTDVPGVVVQATCELARAALTGPLLPTVERGGAVSRHHQKVGEVEIDTHYAPSATVERSFILVHRMLRGVSQARVGGAGISLARG